MKRFGADDLMGLNNGIGLIGGKLLFCDNGANDFTNIFMFGETRSSLRDDVGVLVTNG